jgi:predicted naringenin-chalcone synthase
MPSGKILTLATAVPQNCYQQAQITDYYVDFLKAQGKSRERAIRAVMNQAGVESRHSVVDADFFRSKKSTQQRNDLYMAEALPMAQELIQRGLDSIGLQPNEITNFTLVSCTGFNIPGLDLLLAGALEMSPHLSRSSILGMGCYGAFPGIKRALDSVKADSSSLALMVAVELCTIHLQFDASAQSVVSSSLFADGAGMLVMAGEDSEFDGLKLIDTETYCDYQTLDQMSFTLTDEGFRMYLSSYVPDILAAHVADFANRLVSRNSLKISDVNFWAIHPGSKRIVEYIQKELGLGAEQVEASLNILAQYGNMSSATVLFVLEEILAKQNPRAGDYIVMMAFGPGLTMEAILLQG